MMASRIQLVAVAAAMALIASCGGSGDDSSSDDADDTVAPTTTAAVADETTTTVAAAPEPTEPPDTDVIDSFDEVQPAVVQIVAQGSFRDPEVGMVSTAGSGSGFVISDDGLVVTNNHVVTGAATLEVFIGGDSSTGYNATIVGVSECNDLALIRLDVDEPLPYLEWSETAPSVGTEVYTAGFPLGDPEYTMTRGIVAKAKAFGDTQWASIDSTIEHDANIQPGNSGGPLVGVDGRVVAVNYASGSVTNQSQFFAIESTLAQHVVDELQDGDFESLGINGTAVVDEEAGLAGVWVAGTAPGSPAAVAGLLPGDIVTTLNGLPIGTDGTMKDYCDVIRTAGERPIAVEVLRFDTQEILRGEINGTIPLEQVVSFADEIVDDVDVADAPTEETYTTNQTLVDDTGTITVDVPVEWADVDTAPFVLDDGSSAPWIGASTSIADLYSGSYGVPGMFITSFPAMPFEDIAGSIAEFAPADGECGYDEGLTDYDDGAFVGQYELWGDCGGAGAAFVILIANANSGQGSVVVGVQLLTDADFEALNTIMATFNYL